MLLVREEKKVNQLFEQFGRNSNDEITRWLQPSGNSIHWGNDFMLVEKSMLDFMVELENIGCEIIQLSEKYSVAEKKSTNETRRIFESSDIRVWVVEDDFIPDVYPIGDISPVDFVLYTFKK